MAINAPERGIEIMKEKITLRKRGQFTLPKAFMEELNLHEGDSLELRLEDGKLVIVPLVQIPADQAFFWSDEWQEGEREAKQNIRDGNISEKMNANEIMAHLDNLMEKSE